MGRSQEEKALKKQGEPVAHDALEYLASLDSNGVRLGLHRMERALDDLGRPEQHRRTLLVAGTNGKGSTCAMLASALQAAGYRIGLYTSPHLHRFTERIQLDSRPVSDEELAELLKAVRRACPWQDDPANGDRLTYFELATLLGLLCFARHEVDVAIVETGLGGHLDATAVVRPCAVAMTKIGLDHREYFGDSLREVARAEASIFKPGVPVAVAPGQPVELVFGVMADKDYREILHTLSRGVRRVHLCPALTPRSLAPAECASSATELGLLVSTHSTCTDALRAARRAAGTRGLVCATGSFSVVAEVRRLLLGDRVLSDGERRWT